MTNSIYMIMFFLLHQVCERECSVAHVDQVLTAQEGDSVSLSCLLLNDQLHRVLWYKQVLGEKPSLIVSSYHHSQPNEFSPHFERTHFHAERKDDSFNLTILRTLKSDSGMYFCGSAFTNIVTFGTGTILLVRGADLKPAVTQQPVLGVIKPGSNVTLQCLVQAKMCDKEVQLVYWFRRGSDTILPGMVYRHGDVKSERGKDSAASSPTQSCFYNLSKINVSLSDAGLYYCAVLTCGEILFGNGTTLVIEDGFNCDSLLFFISIGLAVMCTVSVTINILLCIPLRRQGGTSQQIQTTNNDITRVHFRSTDDINYAALNLSTKRGQRKRTLEETPYSRPVFRDKI